MIRIGLGVTGSFCTFKNLLAAAEDLILRGYDITPVFSFSVASLDTRFFKAADFADVEFRALLGALPEDSRLIFQLFYGERFTVSEIASILNQNENTVKSRLRRGRERLRASLGEGERRTAR